VTLHTLRTLNVAEIISSWRTHYSLLPIAFAAQKPKNGTISKIFAASVVFAPNFGAGCPSKVME
jgi:hypothetical protein